MPTLKSDDSLLSAVFHNYGDVFSGQAARLISLALSLDNRSDALIRLADEAAAKGLPAGPLTNKSVPEHRLVGVSCG